MVESALKTRLAAFPQITARDFNKLYDLADILTEIVSAMEDVKYSTLLSYYNTSAGVIPVVRKLPYNIQEKWTSHAVNYKNRHNVIFPPFKVFAEFIREMGRVKNDPSFRYDTQESRQPQKKPDYAVKPAVTARKTDVKKQDERCPIHQTNHSLADCNSFKMRNYEKHKMMKEKGISMIPSCTINRTSEWDSSHFRALEDPLYLTIDMDFFDPSAAPGVGTPEPGGVDYKGGLSFLRFVASTREVQAFDLVELLPLPGRPQTEVLAARLIYELLLSQAFFRSG